MGKEQKPNTLQRLCTQCFNAIAELDTSFGAPDYIEGTRFPMEDALRQAGMTQYAPPIINRITTAAIEAVNSFHNQEARALSRLPKLKDAMEVYFKISGTLRKRADAMEASSTKTFLEQGADIATAIAGALDDLVGHIEAHKAEIKKTARTKDPKKDKPHWNLGQKCLESLAAIDTSFGNGIWPPDPDRFSIVDALNAVGITDHKELRELTEQAIDSTARYMRDENAGMLVKPAIDKAMNTYYQLSATFRRRTEAETKDKQVMLETAADRTATIAGNLEAVSDYIDTHRGQQKGVA